MNRVSSSKLLLAAGLAAFAAAAFQTIATAQTPATAPPPAAATAWKAKNLKVLPADIPRPQLIGVMKSFTRSLGVECEFCHVKGADGKLDPASDAKKEKAAARWMLTMVAGLNQQFHVKEGEPPKVTCYTCHRGSPHPQTSPPPSGDANQQPPPQS